MESEMKKEKEEKCEDELPDNPPSVEEEEEAPEDGWFCPQYSELPLSIPPVAEEEIERIGTS